MKQGLKAQGFTVVEVLIVLAVSSALMIVGLLLINGQQQRTEFTTSINEIKSQIDQVINNVATGNYTKDNTFKCTGSSTGPSIDKTTNIVQGENIGCTFIGRAIQFSPDGKSKEYYIYNLVGLQFKGGIGFTEVNSLVEAMPIALYPSSNLSGKTLAYTSVPDAAEKRTLQYGLKAIKMTYDTDSIPTNDLGTGVVAIVTDFATASVSGGLNSSSRVASLYAIRTTALGGVPGNVVDKIDYPNTAPGGTYFQISPMVKRIAICFEGSASQYGILTIGGNGRQLTSDLKIGGGSCPATI